MGGLGIVTASSEAGELHALALSIAWHRREATKHRLQVQVHKSPDDSEGGNELPVCRFG